MSVEIKFADSPGIIGWAIRCEQPEEETQSDIADFAETYLRGDREAYDEEGEVVDHTTMTQEQALVFARREIEEGDWGRDGWSVSWVSINTTGLDAFEITFVGDRDEMHLFPTADLAVQFAEALIAGGSKEKMEVWGIIE